VCVVRFAVRNTRPSLRASLWTRQQHSTFLLPTRGLHAMSPFRHSEDFNPVFPSASVSSHITLFLGIMGRIIHEINCISTLSTRNFLIFTRFYDSMLACGEQIEYSPNTRVSLFVTHISPLQISSQTYKEEKVRWLNGTSRPWSTYFSLNAHHQATYVYTDLLAVKSVARVCDGSTLPSAISV
jgi:hypothetical protein